MREITLNDNDAGKRLDRFLAAYLPHLPPALTAKLIRKKFFRINGVRVTDPAMRLTSGDVLAMYLSDAMLTPPAETEAYRFVDSRLEGIVFEDENLLTVDKKPGLVVHADDTKSPDTLIARIQAYLREKGAWDPADEHSFVPALCNRIDRNTGGIVIAAKNAEALRIMDEKVKNREIEKIYLAAVVGTPRPAAGRLEGYIFKDAKNNQVYVYDAPRTGTKTAVTEYKTIASDGRLTLVECRLITGRTHQIRAQFRHAGCPLLGDGKYGREKDNRAYGEKGQALCSWRLRFVFDTPAGALEYLNGKSFRTKTPEFVEKYFPTFAERMKT